MNTVILPAAESDLEHAFDWYEKQRRGLGQEFLTEFRRGLDRILDQPAGWQSLDAVYRRYRLHRFPYGIVYRAAAGGQILIVAVMHLSQQPDNWRGRN